MVKIKESAEKYFTKKNLVLLYKLILAILVLLVAYYFVSVLIHKNDSKKASAKIDQYIKAEDCKKAIDGLASLKPESLNTETRIKLYNYQMNCYADLEKYPEAITAAQNLKAIYAKQGKGDLVQAQNNIIENLKASQTEKQNEQKQPKGSGHDTTPVL